MTISARWWIFSYPTLTRPVRALQSTGKSKTFFTWHYALVKNSLPYLKRIKKHKTLISYLTFLILGILIMFIDIQCAGLLQRYISDFAIFIFIGTTLILFSLYIQMKDKEVRKIFIYTVLFLCLIGILYNLSLFFLPDSDNIALTNPQLYSQFYRLFH